MSMKRGKTCLKNIWSRESPKWLERGHVEGSSAIKSEKKQLEAVILRKQAVGLAT